MIKIRTLLLIILFCSCASNTTIRVPKEKRNKVIFVGNATAVPSIEDGKRIALNDVVHQILYYIGVDVSSTIYSDRSNYDGVIFEQVSLISSAILQSIKIRKIKVINKRRVYAEKYGVFDAYDIHVYVEVNIHEIKRLKQTANRMQTDTIVREFSVANAYTIPENPIYKQLEANKATMLYNDEDKYPNTVVTLPFGFRLESAAFSLIFPGFGQFLNYEFDKGHDYSAAAISSLLLGYIGYPYCYAIGGMVWGMSILDAYICAENKYNSVEQIKELK